MMVKWDLILGKVEKINCNILGKFSDADCKKQENLLNLLYNIIFFI